MNKRNTIQRSLVLEAACALDHPTADAVYRTVSNSHPTISRGTVYRNLNLLVEQGTLAKVALPDGADHFDHTIDKHYHLYCRCCGKVVDAALSYQPRLLDSVGDTQGFVIEGHDIVLRGICSACRTAEAV